MLIEEIMSDGVISVDIDATIVEVSRVMGMKNIGLVGVTENDKLIGVVTDRDIVVKVIANKSLRLGDFISRNIVTIEKSESIDSALKLMGEYRIKRLIVTESGNPIGVLSISDILGQGFTSLLSETFSRIYKIEGKKD